MVVELMTCTWTNASTPVAETDVFIYTLYFIETLSEVKNSSKDSCASRLIAQRFKRLIKTLEVADLKGSQWRGLGRILMNCF